MKRFFVAVFIMVLLLAFASGSWAAPFLACDLPVGGTIPVAKSEVEITKVSDGSVNIVDGTLIVRDNNVLLLDLAGLAADRYHFRARWEDAMGLPSEWSLFFIAGKPAPAVGLRVVP